MSQSKYPVTPDCRYFVVRGRLWRRSNPLLPESERSKYVKLLGRARSALRRTAQSSEGERKEARLLVNEAKTALGERGPVWWDDGSPDYNRHLAKNTPYRQWFEALPS